MRALIAMILAYPVYYALDSGWIILAVIGLQLIAGLDFIMFEKDD